MNNHTQTPWIRSIVKIDKKWLKGQLQEGVVNKAGDTVIAICSENDANAAFIVRACNAHDALVEALETLVDNYLSRDGDMKALAHFISEGAKALKLAKGE